MAKRKSAEFAAFDNVRRNLLTATKPQLDAGARAQGRGRTQSSQARPQAEGQVFRRRPRRGLGTLCAVGLSDQFLIPHATTDDVLDRGLKTIRVVAAALLEPERLLIQVAEQVERLSTSSLGFTRCFRCRRIGENS